MFIDDLTLHLKAGRGGEGVVRFRHEKGKDHAGPSGGNGGKGGDVYALTIRDIAILSAYRHVKNFVAGRGEDGAGSSKQGKVGKDVEIRLPIGARLTNLSTGYFLDLLKDGEKVLLLQGGRGGLGNEHFKSSTNVRPAESSPGALGEEVDFHIELLLVADVGIIGLPNAGKSSLLNVLTRAHSAVGDFPFTTLEPALGSFYGLILADIPGLIEGAAEGRGLGHKFLRHIERTKTLLHCISAEVENPLVAYQIVRKELALYNKEILDKSEMIALTKIDLVTEPALHSKLSLLNKISKNVFPISILDNESLKNFQSAILNS